MENNRVSTETIEKYYDCLVELKNLLSYTSRISLDDFCKRKNLSKSVPQVLSKGGIIKCITKGRYSEWQWTSIDPTKQMALKTIQMLGEYNPPRKKQPIKKHVETRGGARPNSGRKTKQQEVQNILENKKIKVVLFWGLFTFYFNV
jgi:hypothetical protein